MDEERQRDATQVEYGELPELARAMRALGSQRHSGATHAAGSMQAAFFQPLLEARRRAADARDAAGRIQAFDARDLARHLERAIERIVNEWPDTRASTRRAVRAQLVERVSNYSTAITALGERASAALEAGESLRLQAWRDWTSQLASTFDAADRCWISLKSAAASIPARPGTR